MNYYQILEVPVHATQRDIKVAYRKMVQKYHPDVNSNTSEEYIKLINVAYETLSDPVKKQTYDSRVLHRYRATAQATTPNSTYQRTRRTPHYYRPSTTQPEYDFSVKRQLIGWLGAIIIIGIAVGGIKLMEVYASVHFFNKAREAEQENRLYEALSLYEEAIRDWGLYNAEASIKRAVVSQHLEAYHNMAESAQQGLGFSPTNTQKGQLYFLLGVAYTEIESPERAVHMLQKSLVFKYNKDSVYAYLAPVYLTKLKQYSLAVEAYTYLIGHQPAQATWYAGRAQAYQLQGAHVKAINDLLYLYKTDPGNGQVLFQLGRSYLALGETDKACYYLKQSQQHGITLDPNEMAAICK